MLDAAVCIFNILKELPENKVTINEDEPLSLTPNFNSFFIKFMEHLKQKLNSADIEKLNPDTVVAFYRCLENKDYAKIDESFVIQYKQILQRKIP